MAPRHLAGTQAPCPKHRSGEWTHYGGNAASQKYSPLDQINKDNVGKLTIAWRWASPDNAVVAANPDGAARDVYTDTPLMVKGVLYTVTSLGQIAAINPGTGQSIWLFDPGNWKTGRPGNLGFVHRGIAYWTDPRLRSRQAAEGTAAARHERRVSDLRRCEDRRARHRVRRRAAAST